MMAIDIDCVLGFAHDSKQNPIRGLWIAARPGALANLSLDGFYEIVQVFENAIGVIMNPSFDGRTVNNAGALARQLTDATAHTTANQRNHIGGSVLIKRVKCNPQW